LIKTFSVASLIVGLVVLSVLFPTQVRPAALTTQAPVPMASDAGGQVTFIGIFHWGVEGGRRPLGILDMIFPYITVDGKNYRLVMTGQNSRSIGLGTGSYRDGELVEVTGWLQISPSTNNLTQPPMEFEGIITVTSLQPA